MTQKLVGITKAAITGAAFGGIIGMVAVPRAKRKKHRHHSFTDNAGQTLRTVGIAMQDVADVIQR